MFTHTEIHQIGLVRRLAGALTGSLLALVAYSAYHDIGSAVHAMVEPSTEHVSVNDSYDAKVQRVKEFADSLKKS